MAVEGSAHPFSIARTWWHPGGKVDGACVAFGWQPIEAGAADLEPHKKAGIWYFRHKLALWHWPVSTSLGFTRGEK